MLSWLNKQTNKQKNGSRTRIGPKLSEMSKENTLKELQKVYLQKKITRNSGSLETKYEEIISGSRLLHSSEYKQRW